MKKRKDCFWGIHSDFHVRPEFGVIGDKLCEEDIRTICRELKPDYWQIDCKGHFGWASYPTEIGNAVPEFALDNYEMWRRVTKEEGVALYLHYSGVDDVKYGQEHPTQRVLNADGSYDEWATRCDGPYVDDILIPQLSEAAEKYGIDGVWIDGECWGTKLDYRYETLRNFEKETGICLNGTRPVKKGDPYFEEYVDYHRKLFRRYVEHYLTVLHEKHPDFQIASNFMYSEFMPEEPTLDVDYLSGDNSPSNSVMSARLTARALAQHGKPWDLMGVAQCYGETCVWDLLPKHPVQMMQVAAATISMGGGFMVGLSLLFDGSPHVPNLLKQKPLAEFVREREAYCFKGKPIHQAAMLLSTYDHYKECTQPFQVGDAESKRGFCGLLCDAGQSLEVVSEHNLLGKTDAYAMIAIPEIKEDLEKETVQALLDYAKNGGNLLLNGVNTCRIFSEAGAPFEVKPVIDRINEFKYLLQINDIDDQRYWTIDGIGIGTVMHPIEIAATGDHKVMAKTCYAMHHPWHPFAVLMDYGKGKIAAIGADLGVPYYTGAQYLHRDLIKMITKEMYTPMAQIESVYGLLELVCLEKDGRLMLQLVNANGNHTNQRCETEDMIPPALDIKLSVACPEKPQQILLQPGNKELDFEYRDGRAYFEVDRVYIHNVAEIRQ